MRKIIIFLSLLAITIIPFNVFAITNQGKISSTSSRIYSDQTKVGDSFTISFSVLFSGLQKNTYDTYGVGAVGINIQTADDFILSSVSSNIWDTTAYDLGGGSYYLVSEYIEGSDDSNACIEKELYCSNYTIDVEFFVKNTSKTSSSIVMTSATAGFLDLSKGVDEITEDDVITSTYNYTNTVVMNIKQLPNEEKDTYQEPVNITETTNGIPSITPNVQLKESNTNSTINTVSNESSNYLKVLEVEGYSIEFSKDTKKYYIDIKDDTNALKVNALAEDENATVEILGADDLKKNDDEIIINVKSTNGSINTYKISISREDDESDEADGQLGARFKIEKKHIIIGSVLIGVIILISIIVLIINRRRDKKIDNMLDSI